MKVLLLDSGGVLMDHLKPCSLSIRQMQSWYFSSSCDRFRRPG